ncbi:MAG: hypothetical protein AAF219_01210 [Myxococcota bacterium]
MTEWLEGTCGACIAFVADSADEKGPRGRCRLRAELGEISHRLPRCPKYVERGTGKRWKPPRVYHGRASNRLDDDAELDRKSRRTKPPTPAVVRTPSYGAHIDLGGQDVDTEALKDLITDVLRDEGVTGDIPIGKRWEGGKVVIIPGDTTTQSKEIPLDAFFHKIVMVRDKLRVLEQKINASKNLSDAEKVDLEQYITRCYGSLTTFNVLFRDREDQFRGSGK